MRRCMAGFYVALFTLSAYALELNIHVIDEAGCPVTNAVLELATEADRMGRLVDSPRMRYETWKVDGAGHVKKSFTCYSAFMHMTTKAPGYYEEYDHIKFKIDGDSFFLGAHIAETAHDLKVTLRRKINPIPMYSYAGCPDIKLPSVKGRFGFDMMERDWVAPYGNGHVSDFFIEYEELIEGERKLYLATIDFPNKHDGAYKKSKHASHSFKSDYHADRVGSYQKRFSLYSFKKSGAEYSINCFVTKDDYLVLRTRSRVDAKGNVISAHYSKIYGPIYVEKIFHFRTYAFNPNENDTNLEFDPERNLVPKRKRREMGGGEP